MERRDGDVTILPSGDVRMVETWVVQFNGGPFHNAFRSIDMSRVEEVADVGVSEGDQNYSRTSGGSADNTVAVDVNSRYTKITWYFPSTTDATRTFTLRYTLRGVVRIYPGGDQFWWTFVEADRAYPINAAHVVEHLPVAFTEDQIKLATYPGPGQAQRVDDRTITFDGGPFPPGAEWEIRTQFPHGVVTSPAPDWQIAEDTAPVRAAQQQQAAAQMQQVVSFVQLAGGILLLVGGLLGTLVWYYARIRQKPVPLPAEYLTAPPDSLPPGLAGALLNGRASIQDVVATLVDLARRGFLKMSGDSQGYVFARPAGGDAEALRPYERRLVDAFSPDNTTLELAQATTRAELTIVGPAVMEALKEELVSAGYYLTRPPLTLISLLPPLAALVAIVLLLLSSSWLTRFDLLAFIVVMAALTGVRMAKPRTRAQVAETLAKWRAFKRYLQHIHQYTQVAQAQQLFDKYLAYAIAFDLQNDWVKTFAAVNTPVPAWFDWSDTTPERERQRGERERQRQDEQHAPGQSLDFPTPGHLAIPSLNEISDGAFRGLNDMSTGFLGMLNGTADVLTHAVQPSSWSESTSERGSSYRGSSSSSSGGWSGGGGGGSSGGGGSGGGSSGFG